jgi:hypothetical protein
VAALCYLLWPHAILIKPDNQKVEQKLISEGMKKCFYCAELIKQEVKSAGIVGCCFMIKTESVGSNDDIFPWN